jgi:hypothetical protein
MLQHFAATQATGWWPGGLEPLGALGSPLAAEEAAAEQPVEDSPGPSTDLSPSPVQ